MTRLKPTYEVGYGKPPKATQFQPGRSGNPKGRPKGSVNLKTALEAALSEPVVVRENGRSRSYSKAEVMVKQVVNKAAGGNLQAFQHVTRLAALFPTDQPGISALDQAQNDDPQILAQLVERMRQAAHSEIATLLSQDESHGPSSVQTNAG